MSIVYGNVIVYLKNLDKCVVYLILKMKVVLNYDNAKGERMIVW